MLMSPSSFSIQPRSQSGDDQGPWEQSPIGAAVEKLVIPWGAVLANLKAGGLRLTLRKSRLGLFLLAKEAVWQGRTLLYAPIAPAVPSSISSSTPALYRGTVHDEEHLELALRLVREGRAAKSAMIARFGKEVSDDDGDGNTARDGRGAEQGDGENREGYEGRAEGFSGCVGRLKPTVGLDQTPLAG